MPQPPRGYVPTDAPRRGWRRTLGLFAVLAALLAIQAGGAAAARADSCSPYGSGWSCEWGTVNLEPGKKRWFQAPNGNNLRNWYWGTVWDGHGGSVAQKCVHVMRGSDGYTIQVACGSGSPAANIPGYMQPGYMFIRHGAPGPRTLYGMALH